MGKHRKIEVGTTISDLEILENLGLKMYCGHMSTFFKCKCLLCGSTCELPIKTLGISSFNCGCKRKTATTKLLNIGKKYNGFEIVSGPIPGKKNDCYSYKVKCPYCGKIFTKRSDSIRSGDGISCGCIKKNKFVENRYAAYKNNFINDTSKSKVVNDIICENNTSGYPNVSWHKGTSKWCVRITYKKKSYSLGYYNDIEVAAVVARQAREERKKDFLRWYEKFMQDELKRAPRTN